MTLKKQEPGPIKFWTPLRLVSTLIVLALVAVFAASSCNSNDPPSKAVKTTGTTATMPSVVMATELKSANGQPIKLSNYSGKVLLVNLWATWGGPGCNSTAPPPKASKTTGTTATMPSVVMATELKSANGQPIKLSNYSGKVLLVNLWATWCGPCRRATPELVKLHKEYQDRGLEMVGLTTEDPVSSSQSVQQFA